MLDFDLFGIADGKCHTTQNMSSFWSTKCISAKVDELFSFILFIVYHSIGKSFF